MEGRNMQCMLPVRQLRGYVCLLGFGFVFLWIISGVYLPVTPQSSRGLRVGRHLLGLMEDGDNDTSTNCSNTELYGRVDVDKAHCSDIHDIGDNSSTCLYVTCVDSCQNDEGIIDYLNFIYCQMPSNLIPLALVILFVWLVFLFIVLGATAEEYFCPALTVMSQVLRLSQNVAGVTLLALGNGAPDIFSAFAAINQEDDQKASLAVGALFGAGIFVTTVVVGAVTITKPFTLTQRPFLRDIIFYMFAVFWTFYLLWSNYVNIYHACGFVLMYCVYVVVVILGRVLYQRWKKWRKIKGVGTGDIPTAPSPPEGEELSSSQPSSKSLASGLQNGLFSHLPSPDPHPGSIQTSQEDVEEIKRENEDPRAYRIPSIGVSESSGVEGHVVRIRVVDEDEEINEQSGLLIRPNNVERQNEFTGSLPSHVQSDHHDRLALPTTRRRGGSVGRDYGSVERGTQPERHHKRPKMRKTLSGALDITEEVGAAVGIPHLPQIWEEVHRSHSRSRSSSRVGVQPADESSESEESEDDEEAPLINLKTKRRNPFVKMLQGIWPFGESFKQLGLLGKIYEVLKSPASLLLALTVPVVDRNEDDANWNKWLNVLHCVTSPMFIILITKYRFYLIGGYVPVAAIIFIIGLIIAVIVALTSKNEKPPIYHCVYAWVGFAVAVTWIYSTANEIVNLLQAFGVVIHLSEGILGLTLLAWGNSIGDAVSNVTMSKQGFPRMAIGACFGGPLLNMLLGIGVASLFKSARRQAENFTFKLYFTQVELIASLFLMISLSCSLVVISILKFKLKRLYGIFLVCIYVTFLTLAILAEVKVFQIVIPGVITIED